MATGPIRAATAVKEATGAATAARAAATAAMPGVVTVRLVVAELSRTAATPSPDVDGVLPAGEHRAASDLL
ncbi:MAG: hypothetical protein WBL53_09550 [Pseudonocardiaceae bacterium]